MTEYHIPTAAVMANDTGNSIRVISVGQPFNGQTLKGSVALTGTTIVYTPPPTDPGSGGARDSNILQRSSNAGIGSTYGFAQGGGVSYDIQVGDLCVLAYICKIEDDAAARAALEPGWSFVHASANATRRVSIFSRWADAAYVALQTQPRYMGFYAQFYPFFTTNAYRSSGSFWALNFRPPEGVAQADFVQSLLTGASDGPAASLAPPAISRVGYRYTYFDAQGNAVTASYVIPAQPANALTWGVSHGPNPFNPDMDDFNMELTGDCDPGPYPDTAQVNGAQDVVFWSVVINESAKSAAPPAAINDVFGYTIQDIYGQTAFADVFVSLAAPNTATTANTVSNTTTSPSLG